LLLSDERLAIVGAGQMGEALLRGFLSAGVVKPGQVVLSDVNEERLKSLKSKYSVTYSTNNEEAVDGVDLVLLAVKPQQISETIDGIRPRIKDRTVLISIAAGVTTGRLTELTGMKVPVIRVMPNTPALVGKAMSVLCRGEYADQNTMNMALELFKAVGEAIELSEKEIDVVTAISGSGPAYFFLLVEKLVEAGISAGLSVKAAELLASQTFIGAANLLESGDKSPGELREMVTSPGGTTAAALKVFRDRDFGVIVQEAVNAAIKRAGELA
jgi:pyrroline-5-carboxylate reductase